VTATYQPEYDSHQDHYDEYTSLVRASYNRLFEALLEEAVEHEASEPIPPA
jgi:hypothetical protein